MSDETAPPQRGRKENPSIQGSSVQASEQIVRIPLSEVHPFPDHPYRELMKLIQKNHSAI